MEQYVDCYYDDYVGEDCVECVVGFGEFFCVVCVELVVGYVVVDEGGGYWLVDQVGDCVVGGGGEVECVYCEQ